MVKWTSARVSRVFDRLLGPRAELQELTYLLYAVTWGVMMLVLPNALTASIVFSRMNTFASDFAWGGLLVLFGLLGIAGYVQDDVKLRRFVAMFHVLLWTLISYFLFMDFRPVVGVVAVPLCAVMSILTYIRLGIRE